MAPLSFSGSFASSTRGYRDSKDDVVLQLTERLREREDELRQVCNERDRMEDQLNLRGNLPVHLDVAYEELLAHCKEREEEYKKTTEQHKRETVALEDKCRDLERKLEDQNKILDKYEDEVKYERNEMEEEIRSTHHRLELAVVEIEEKEKRMISLENMVDRLRAENDRLLETEEEDKGIIARLGKRMDNVQELEMLNFQLEERLERREELLRQKSDELNNYKQFQQDEMKNMELHMRKVIDRHHNDLQEREREIVMLKRDIEKYEVILDEADYVTREQRIGLRAREERIDELSMAIERSQNSGLLSRFDKMCTM